MVAVTPALVATPLFNNNHNGDDVRDALRVISFYVFLYPTVCLYVCLCVCLPCSFWSPSRLLSSTAARVGATAFVCDGPVIPFWIGVSDAWPGAYLHTPALLTCVCARLLPSLYIVFHLLYIYTSRLCCERRYCYCSVAARFDWSWSDHQRMLHIEVLPTAYTSASNVRTADNSVRGGADAAIVQSQRLLLELL